MNPVLKKDREKLRIEEYLDLWQRMRQKRIASIMNLLKSQKEVDEDQFLGLMSTEYGIRRQTLVEYLKGLQDYGVIEIHDGKIKWLGKEQSEERRDEA